MTREDLMKNLGTIAKSGPSGELQLTIAYMKEWAVSDGPERNSPWSCLVQSL